MADEPDTRTAEVRRPDTEGEERSPALPYAVEYRGPIPPPQMLAQLNEVVANGAERTFAMAEEAQRHNIAMERAAMEANIRSGRERRYFAFALILGCIVGAVATAALGHPEVAVAFLGVPIFGAITAFIIGRARKPREEDDEPNVDT